MIAVRTQGLKGVFYDKDNIGYKSRSVLVYDSDDLSVERSSTKDLVKAYESGIDLGGAVEYAGGNRYLITSTYFDEGMYKYGDTIVNCKSTGMSVQLEIIRKDRGVRLIKNFGSHQILIGSINRGRNNPRLLSEHKSIKQSGKRFAIFNDTMVIVDYGICIAVDMESGIVYKMSHNIAGLGWSKDTIPLAYGGYSLETIDVNYYLKSRLLGENYVLSDNEVAENTARNSAAMFRGVL